VNDEIANKINVLPGLGKAQLRALWTENFSKEPPSTLRKQLMVPLLAYRLQEREYGGLSHTARRRLRQIAASSRMDKPPRLDGDTGPQTGTKLIRSWHGEVHEVIATGSGYEYRGQTYSSLSKIARNITGTRWSGPLFFGVRKP